MMTEKTYELVAICASGLEGLVAEEISLFKAVNVKTLQGAVSFEAPLETAYNMCLWSRFASRILLNLLKFDAPDTDSLYKEAGKINWDEHLGLDSSFAVDCTAVNSKIGNSKFAALRIKDAVADWFRERYNERPGVETRRPDVKISLFLNGEKATISIDLSGESLHRRGYRSASGKAPLKETLAAAIVHLSGWNKDLGSRTMFLDPMCGSGTLLIEAALIYGDVAPGLGRNYFGFLKWKEHDRNLWDSLVSAAIKREENGQSKPWPRILGYDYDRGTVRAAIENIEKAGLTGRVHAETQEIAILENPIIKTKKEETGIFVVNPPYGERLAEINEAKYLYKCIGRKLQEKFSGWQASIFTANPDLADVFGLKSKKRVKLYNGPISCQLLCFDLQEETEDQKETGWSLREKPSQEEAKDFFNRLRKNLKPLLKRAKKEEVSCFRIYDADMPEYNMAIDLYDYWIHVQEYAPPKTIEPEKAAKRLKDAVTVIQDLLGVKRNRIFVKVRQQQKGKNQYQKKADKGRLYEVKEGNCRFLINMTDYLDTGFFLDHRITRKRIQENAEKKRFLNLYGYTGTATVHAAMGGANQMTTIDLSPVYLSWAKNNMALNGFGSENHRTIRADCMKWLSESKDKFDLIFVDPPTFSNSKSTGIIFDIQKDHAELIHRAMRRLEKDGLLIFSTNFKRFKLDSGKLAMFNVKEITAETIPFDFEHNPQAHMCWEIRW